MGNLEDSSRNKTRRTQLTPNLRFVFVRCHYPKKVKAVDMRDVNDNEHSDQAFRFPDFRLKERQSVLRIGGIQNNALHP